MAMSLDRNGNGYDISSQNYFRSLATELSAELEPVKHQSVSEARGKLSWKGFEYLLGEANMENEGLGKANTFRGHIVRAIDGSSFFTPRSDDLLKHFSVRQTKSDLRETHYPYGLCVAAINVFTGQPVCAVIGDYKSSERSLLSHILPKFEAGDISLLDRGLGGNKVYFEYETSGQYFIHRTKTTGERVAMYVQDFLASGKKQKKYWLTLLADVSGEARKMKVRLILGPIDSEGKPIVFVTNLIARAQYPRKEIIELYQKRWSCETLFDRVKNLLRLENFHAKTYNGVMQEIFANLLILSLAASAVTTVIEKDKLDPEVERPGFKNAVEVIKRHINKIIDQKPSKQKPRIVVAQILHEVRAVKYKVRPNRSHPRVSFQPIGGWNLKRSAKIKAFLERNAA
jgi:hypothetical protein